MNLYELSSIAQELSDLLDEEIIDEQTFNDTLEAIGYEEKLEAFCKIIRQKEYDLEALENEIKKLTAKKQAIKNGIDRMKGETLNFMDCTGMTKTKAGVFSISKRNSKAVSITNEATIPDKFWEAQKPKLSKTKIKDAIQSGELVPGAEIVTNVSVVIR